MFYALGTNNEFSFTNKPIETNHVWTLTARLAIASVHLINEFRDVSKTYLVESKLTKQKGFED